jgi:hypothetical protein
MEPPIDRPSQYGTYEGLASNAPEKLVKEEQFKVLEFGTGLYYLCLAGKRNY